ncbi:iron ABC transporter permease [Riemerella anatipestifer]|uniref:iron ABC transporter permease n=1 Tax=Riemerella anatipestifer TaxID=34085 RepID=UPI0012B3AFB4|nr:iron ABC transporter permease [Riemerella anatipestifer]MSN85920.1 iron ABC transporter permease [Riemerella anatipestifer]WFS33233.1 iron ABC transporter permease [Riemerella anatipestifer]
MLRGKFGILMVSILLAIIVLVIVNLNVGYLDLSLKDFFQNTPQSDIASLRINRTLAVLLAGMAIPTSGFLLQEYFQNPLAGPSVLGITSIASLSVAFYIFFSHQLLIPEFLQNGFISLVAIIGSLGLMFFLILLSNRFRDNTFLVIFGFLISALAGAIISILQVYAENQSLKNYILWSFGANNQLNHNQMIILVILIGIGLIFSFRSIKPLIGSSLGTAYAKSFGINTNALKVSVILASSLLSASVTAFLGPILFIGIVVPHFCRMIFSPALLWHQWVLNLTLGIAIMELFSILSEISKLPLNIITSLFGIPVILVMMMKQRSKY